MATRSRRGSFAAAALSLLARGGPRHRSQSAAAPVKDRYIVVLKDSVRASGSGRPRHADGNASERVVYRAALNGYAAHDPARAGRRGAAATRASSTSSRIAVMHAFATQSERPLGPRPHRPAIAGRSTATYTYSPTGLGVTAYILDTGIRASHAQFGGRVGSRLHRRSTTATGRTTATAMAPMSPARSAARPTGSRRAFAWCRSGCSIAAAAARSPGSSRGSTG